MNDETTGWIKLHRSFLDHPIGTSKDCYLIQLWLYLLLSVNHKQKDILINGKRITIYPGQGIFGLNQIVKDLTGIADETKPKFKKYKTIYYRRLKILENIESLKLNPTNKYTTITILNWQEYQSNETQLKLKRNSTETQMKTNKNDKNENTNTKYSSLEKINSSDKDEIAKTYGVSLATVEDEYENLKLYCESKGVSYRNYKAALINFIKRSKRTTSNNATLII